MYVTFVTDLAAGVRYYITRTGLYLNNKTNIAVYGKTT